MTAWAGMEVGLPRGRASQSGSGKAGNHDRRCQAEGRPAAAHLGQRREASWVKGRVTEPMRYTTVIERSRTNNAAYSPDLPKCVAAGSSEAEAIREIREAIRFHIESFREQHQSVPEPCCTAAVVDVLPAAG